MLKLEFLYLWRYVRDKFKEFFKDVVSIPQDIIKAFKNLPKHFIKFVIDFVKAFHKPSIWWQYSLIFLFGTVMIALITDKYKGWVIVAFIVTVFTWVYKLLIGGEIRNKERKELEEKISK